MALATAAVLAVAYVAIVTVVDPRGEFGSRAFPKVVYDARGQKVAFFREYAGEAPVEGLVLGSSRAMKFRPSELQALSGKRFFNFSVDLGRTDDFLAIYRWVRGQGMRPAVVLLGFDAEMFATKVERHFKLEGNHALRSALEPVSPLFAGTRRWVLQRKNALTTAYAADTLRSVRLALGRRETINATFDSDGYLHYPRFEAERANGTFDLEAELAACVRYQRRYFGGTFTEPQPARRAEFERLLAEMTADGVTVKLFFTSLHPRLGEVLEAMPRFLEQMALNRAAVEEWRQRYGVETYDFSAPRLYDGTLTGWYDCAHVDEVNASLMSRALLSKAR